MDNRHEWTVTGMDCAGCASKITHAVQRLPGVSDPKVTVMAQKLTLQLDGDATSPAQIEDEVRKLGFGIKAPERHNHDHVHGHDHGPTDGPWYASPKGRLVIGTGLLLVIAWVIRLTTAGTVGHWAFVAACLIGVAPVARSAFAMLRRGQPFTIESLMTIAAAGALLIGAAEEAALVVFLFAVGEVLEGVASNKARNSIRALSDLVPKTALLEQDGKTREVPAASLEPGQIVLVRPGDRIPADGRIIDGISGIDESPVTGESVPVTRGPDDDVFAGAINTEAALRVTVTTAAADNTISRIIRLVEEAEESRAPTERFIDRFSRWYMPVVVALAALTIVIPPM
ncbi:MAG: heavy metal translocating P-type ATPase, partial [Paracoccus sp. (in: a-proteobacteria)]|nr:heavy metal translocating P-type ATPase [Paracoccus sp. (in: a-proteobacteria)]